jgi:hypothetical protein
MYVYMIKTPWYLGHSEMASTFIIHNCSAFLW